MPEQNKELRVLDTSASFEQPNREHAVFVDGEIINVKFEYGKETTVPYTVGLKFIQEGFVVSEGEKVLEIPADTDETIRIHIGEDEVVAKYGELTLSALKIRAASLIGGEKFLVGDAPESEIILFLKSDHSIVEDLSDDDEDDFEEAVIAPTEPEEELDVADEVEPEPEPIPEPEPVVEDATPEPELAPEITNTPTDYVADDGGVSGENEKEETSTDEADTDSGDAETEEATEENKEA